MAETDNACLMSEDDRDAAPQKMTVGELIAELQCHPAGSIVSVGAFSGYGALVVEHTDAPPQT